MPFINRSSESRRKLIFDLIESGKPALDVNDNLRQKNYLPLDKNEETVWFQILHPIASRDEVLYKGLITDGKDISWAGRELKRRYDKQTIS